MADEVVIRLQAQSAQLEASITRLEKSLLRVEQRGRSAGAAISTGANRSAKSINNQNKSFTLMVAKLALVTFAAQTLANIFQNTFGAILKNIDDFQIAAIGAASAITSITSEANRPIADVFAQNLQAVEGIFEELEFVAARFFSTGQELQLAFNTLAQRGVVIREDEFQILGKLTDQIKLLTGGQNAQIQIQQELRAILDGNVRTTTAFGKSLQARGVDVAQLSREVRATGSIAVFEQFLTGLDAAGGAIRRTLTSVLTTFQTLVSILGRNIFQDTFDETVALITRVNNILIENRELIIGIGRFIVTKIKVAWDSIVDILGQVTAAVINLAGNPMVQLVGLALLFKSIFSGGIVGAIFKIAIAAAAITGEFRSFNDVLTIITGAMQILADMVLNFFNSLVSSIQNLGTLAKLIGSGQFSNAGDFIDIRNLQVAISESEKLLAGLENIRKANGKLTEEQAKQGFIAKAALKGQREELEALTASFEANGGATVIDVRAKVGIGNSSEVSDFVSNLLANTADAIRDEVAGRGLDLDNTLEELLNKLALESEGFSGKPKGKIADIIVPVQTDTRIAEAERKRAFKQQDAVIKAIDNARKISSQAELANIRSEAAERNITGLEAFNAVQENRQEASRQAVAGLEQEIALTRERAKAEIATVNANLRADEGVTKLQEVEAQLKVINLISAREAKTATLREKINTVQGKADNDRVKAAATITEETRKVNRLLQERQFNIEGFGGGLTNAERLNQVQTRGAQASADNAANNKGNAGAISAFDRQQAELNIQALIKTQIEAFTGAIEQAFDALIDGILTGSFEFRDLAQSISRDLIKAGMEGLITQAKDAVTKGLTSIFSSFGEKSAQAAAQGLALALGILIAILSRAGNEGDFTATGGGAGGSGVQSTGAVRGLIGGDTSLPIGEINNGLMEALIPTNAILTQIERNTRQGSSLGALDPQVLNDIIAAQLTGLLGSAGLQGTS